MMASFKCELRGGPLDGTVLDLKAPPRADDEFQHKGGRQVSVYRFSQPICRFVFLRFEKVKKEAKP